MNPPFPRTIVVSFADQTQNSPESKCPSKEQLAALLMGELENPTLKLLEEHVEHCHQCQTQLENMAVAGADWQTWQNRLDTLQLTRQKAEPQSDLCPTCGAEQHLPQDHIPANTLLSQESSVGEVTRSADTRHRVSELEKELPVIPGYEIECLLGRGGMGVVYRARQIALNRPVALKMIVTGRHSTLQQLARFQIEAEALACLTHEHIVQIYAYGEHDSGPYLSLELVEGNPLEEILKRKPPAPGREVIPRVSPHDARRPFAGNGVSGFEAGEYIAYA